MSVGIITGSDSDLPKIKQCFEILESFGVDFEIIVSSAHRTPAQMKEWVVSARTRGIKVIIAAAGGAAHLPGVCAAYTTLPVIGIPIESNLSGGLDSLLSIAQMPAGVPVGTMAAGKSGGANAALYALSMLSIENPEIAKKLDEYRLETEKKIIARNEKLRTEGYKKYISSMEGNK